VAVGALATLAAVRLRVLERIGRLVGFSPVGRPVRVWVEGMPGGDETHVVPGTITELRDGGAVVYLRDCERQPRWILAVPREAGWGLHALWFSFITVDAFELENGERLGEWHIRLGSRR
jgi:hypothetical protein